MKRKLLRQTLNDWRANLWLALELLVVSVIVWYTVDYCYTTMVTYNEPTGFDTGHCYKINLYEQTPGSTGYVERTNSEKIADLLELKSRILLRPEVEVASYSNASYPYDPNNASNSYFHDSISSPSLVFNRTVEPDFFRVFRYTGVNGETPEQLADMLDGSGVMISANMFEDKLDTHSLMYDSIYNGQRQGWQIRGIVNPVRYSESAPHGYGDKTMIQKLDFGSDDAIYRMDELCVRVRDNMDKNFINDFMDDALKYYRCGNYFVSSVESFDDIRSRYLHDYRLRLISFIIGLVFLLINVFLGLFGTFWFRTQQRVGEIAIRKINGATRGDIFRRFVGEGLLILTVVTLPAICIDAALTHFELNEPYGGNIYFGWGRFVICVGISYAMIALMIVCGVSVSSWRAMRLNPATALHDE